MMPTKSGREELAASGITLNVTLIFSDRQYQIARDAVWRGAQRRKNGLDGFKSVYSIFVSRVDVYTEKAVPDLSAAAQGLVGIVNSPFCCTGASLNIMPSHGMYSTVRPFGTAAIK